MKHLYNCLILMILVFPVRAATVSNPSTYGIQDGWYVATVDYTNFTTYTNATYTLNVYVKFNKVTTIDFGNGGSVHDGFNNEGYTYTGGSLFFETDYSTNTIKAASTTVTVFQNNSTRTYKIRIE